nr:BPS1-like protein [Gleditsia microphylla]
MGAPSAFSLSLLRIQPRAPAAVAPLPLKTRFDQQLTVELDTLQSQGTHHEEPKFRSANGLVQLLDASITTQRIALESFVNITHSDDADRRAINECLEANVELLDACNYFVEKIEIIKKYLDSLRGVARLVDGSAKANAKALHRALDHLESCQALERESKLTGKRGSCLIRKMLRQKLSHETELSEVMCGSKATALMVCRFLELGLSFDCKSRLPMMKTQSQPTSSCWLRLLQEMKKQAEGDLKLHKRRRGSSLMMTELQQTVSAARDMKEQIKGKRKKEPNLSVEGLKASCRELEDGLEIIEGKVRNLYKSLIDVRMALLGILSQA